MKTAATTKGHTMEEMETGQTNVSDTEAQEQFEHQVQDKLNQVFEDDSAEVEAEETPVESETAISNVANETESESETEVIEKTDQQQESAPTGPTIPDAYRRSLRAYGWEDEEIDTNYQTLGDQFLRTAERIHSNRNKELADWAAAGRQIRETPGPESTPISEAPVLLPVDTTKLKEQWGDDEMIDAIVAPVNQIIDRINAIVPQLEKGQQVAQQAEFDRVRNDVETFFALDMLKPYETVYGLNGSVSDSQLGHRNQVLDTAFSLMAGATALGRQTPPLTDALTMAHDMVAAEFKDATVKQTVVNEARQRQKGLSLKPAASNSKHDDADLSRRQLEQRVQQRLKKVFAE